MTRIYSRRFGGHKRRENEKIPESMRKPEDNENIPGQPPSPEPGSEAPQGARLGKPRRKKTVPADEIRQPSDGGSKLTGAPGPSDLLSAIPQSDLITVSGGTVASAWEDYLRDGELRGLTPGTLRQYEFLARETLGLWGDMLTAGITRRHIEDLVLVWRKRGCAEKTIHGRLTVIKGWINWLVGQRHPVQVDTRHDVPRVTPEKRARRVATDAELDALLSAFEGGTYEGRRNRAMVMVMLDCGLRADEVCALRLSDVATDHSRLQVFGKGAKERAVPLGPTMRGELATWLRYRAEALRESGVPEQDVLFPATFGRRRKPMPLTASTKRWNTIGDDETRRMRPNVLANILQTASRKAGLNPSIHPHALRRTWAIRSLQSGMDMETLRKLGGWANLQTVQTYVEDAGTDLALNTPRTTTVDRLAGAKRMKRRPLGKGK